MTSKDNGGPAFPQLHENRTIHIAASGMTLRDWFAGQAMAGIIIATSLGKHDPVSKHGKAVEAAMALDAYAVADAMLEARK